jgi:hypothetical protein
VFIAVVGCGFGWFVGIGFRCSGLRLARYAGGERGLRGGEDGSRCEFKQLLGGARFEFQVGYPGVYYNSILNVRLGVSFNPRTWAFNR